MITVVITKKHMDYPGYDTYTAHEFLVIGEQILRNIEMVLIEERVSNKKLRKIRNRMNAFNIVEVVMLPICNEDDYHRALERMDELANAESGTPEYTELTQLADAIQTYEEEL